MRRRKEDKDKQKETTRDELQGRKDKQDHNNCRHRALPKGKTWKSLSIHSYGKFQPIGPNLRHNALQIEKIGSAWATRTLPINNSSSQDTPSLRLVVDFGVWFSRWIF